MQPCECILENFYYTFIMASSMMQSIQKNNSLLLNASQVVCATIRLSNEVGVSAFLQTRNIYILVL